MAIGFILLAILLSIVCSTICLATDGQAWWFAVMCAALYLSAVIAAILCDSRRSSAKQMTCKDCKWYSIRNCWCRMHDFDKAFLDEPCDKFKLKGGSEDEQNDQKRGH